MFSMAEIRYLIQTYGFLSAKERVYQASGLGAPVYFGD